MSAKKSAARDGTYVHYVRARQILAERLDATPQEIGMWTWMGAEFKGKPADGLNAYRDPSLHAGQPPQFRYEESFGKDFDYLPQLMNCYYRADDIQNFQPAERYLTFEQVVARFARFCSSDEATALLKAKVLDGKLESYHPRTGGTAGTRRWGEEEGFPPLEQGLFPDSEVRSIEDECGAERHWDEWVVDWKYWGQLHTLSAPEFVALRHVHDPRKAESERENFPGGERPSLGIRMDDDLRRIEADPSLPKKTRLSLSKWVDWAQSNGLPCPSFMHAAIAAKRVTVGPEKVGITPKAFTAKHARHIVRDGEAFLDGWFRGKARSKGERTEASRFRIPGRYGEYDEEGMVAELKARGLYSEIGG